MSDAFQTHGALSWCELLTDDVPKAKAFYTDVVGWQAEDMDMADSGVYTVLKANGAPVGGIMKTPPQAGGPPRWTAYITVDDVDGRLTKAEKAGGTILSPAFSVPGVGRMATVADPTGAVLNFITYEPKDG